MPDKKITQEQEERGYRAEAKFFEEINLFKGSLPKRFVRVERAPAYLDARRIDGFAVFRTWLIFTYKIPLQLKTLKSEMVWDIEPNAPVHVLVNLDWSRNRLMASLRGRLDLVGNIDFAEYIQTETDRPLEDWEKALTAKIEECRKKYK